MKLPADFAVYAEHSDTRKNMGPTWTPRVFNRTEVQEGSRIRRDAGSGVITLGPGVYHITGSSAVTYNDLTEHPDQPGWDTRVIPNGGYCRLRHAADAGCRNEQAIVVGTISSANLLPSFVDAYLDVPRQAELVLEHQVGDRVAEIYMQDNAVHSTWHVFARIAITRVSGSAAEHARAPLARVFDAAFHAYLATPERYRRLYGSYLGAAPKFVPVADGGGWVEATEPSLAAVLRRGVLRFGYAEGAPYVYHDPASGELAGVDWELGNALTEIIRDQYYHAVPGRGLRAEWVRVQVPEGGDPEAARFEVLLEGLRRGAFDIAMSGQADISATEGASPGTAEVDWTAPTALLFTNVLYSGRGRHDVSDLVGGSRERFIDAVKGWPEVRLMCVSNPGPSPTNSAELRDAINAAGGNATLDATGTLPSIKAAIADQTIHFSVGDAVASAWIGNQAGFAGRNLNVAASTRPLQTAQPVSAFTLRAP
jgi:ABC-type amino acid transport substrate-binding protein